jgi:hypothetical protein
VKTSAPQAFKRREATSLERSEPDFTLIFLILSKVNPLLPEDTPADGYHFGYIFNNYIPIRDNCK